MKNIQISWTFSVWLFEYIGFFLRKKKHQTASETLEKILITLSQKIALTTLFN